MGRSRSVHLLVIFSVASMIVTLTLTQSTSTAKYSSSHDAESFQAPHLRAFPPAASVDGSFSRRNLSEANITMTNDPKVLIESKVDNAKGADQIASDTKSSPPQSAKKAEQSKNSDNRPSGVIYQYIPPPPVDLEARAGLRGKIRNLVDLNNATSTALCGIVKDSEPYLDEWVDYHFGLGFHTIYLIDNSKDHELRTWQDRRRKAGYSVRVMPKPGSHRQMYGYHMCAAEHKDEHTYMAFMDVDEFLVLKKHETIDQMLADHLHEGSLAISWYVFGSGKTTAYAPLPVTKRFTFRDGVEKHDRHKAWANVKSILKTADYGGYPQSPHSMKTKRGTWKDTTGGGNFVSNHSS